MATPTIANTPSASYLTDTGTGNTTAEFGSATHTSSGGSDRCLVAVVSVLSNSGTIRSMSTLTWNGVSMGKETEQGHDDGATNATTVAIWTLANPAASTAGAWLLTCNGNINGAQIWAYNVEGSLDGAADAFGTDVDDVSGDTAVSISINPTVANTLCIMAVLNATSTVTTTFSPLTEDDEQNLSSTLNTAIAHGTLASSGAQNVDATLSATNEFSAVAITLEGTAGDGSPALMGQAIF